MRNLSASELNQISGGRRAESSMLGDATHNNTLQPAEENFWTFGGGGWNIALSTQIFAPNLPGTASSYGVLSIPGTSDFGVYRTSSSGFMGALTYNPGSNNFTASVHDSIGNVDLGATMSTGHAVSFYAVVHF